MWYDFKNWSQISDIFRCWHWFSQNKYLYGPRYLHFKRLSCENHGKTKCLLWIVIWLMVRSQKQNEYIFNNITTFFLFILKDIELWFILAQFQASKIQFSHLKIMIFFLWGHQMYIRWSISSYFIKPGPKQQEKLGVLTHISNNISFKV